MKKTITDGFGKQKDIGGVYGDTFVSHREYKTHFFRKHKGWAIDIDMINDGDIKYYVIKDKTGLVNADNPSQYLVKPAEYHATKEEFITHGIPVNHAGHGQQLCLPVKFWRKYEEEKE